MGQLVKIETRMVGIPVCQVDDIQKSLQLLLDAGAQIQQEVTDVGRGMLIAWVKDADNNFIGLRQFS